MNHEDMTKFIFTQILEGLLKGKPLRDIAGELAVSIANITASNIAANSKGKK
jgi:Trp operon repressor